ncbi:MAG: hypothetical protein JXR12_05835 [Neptunomonas phycophila]|uniref:hypothetical protein n=1 Tax=Neptunomonas phycophila TaxID=1572645 RepID=UPI003B8D9852
MRNVKLTSPIIGTPQQKLSEINFRLGLIAIMVFFCLGVAAALKLVIYPDTITGDLMSIFFGLAALLPLSILPSYVKMRRKIKDSIL